MEIRKGRVDLFSSSSTRVTVGSSVGLVDDDDGFGTLGGFVNLVDTRRNRVIECAMVSEHVVRPYTRDENDEEMARPSVTGEFHHLEVL